MTNRENPLYWSLPCGVWFGTSVRVSVFFPLIVLVLCVRLHTPELGFQLGLLASVVLFFSVLLHEFGHVAAARTTGGSANEILIWPLGGLANVRTTDDVRARVLTALSGPLMNLVVCSLTAWFVYDSGQTADALNPFVLPAVTLSDTVLRDIMLVTFSINWVLFAANLIPVYPLDGGRVVETLLTSRIGSDRGPEVYIKVGTVVAILLLIAGLLVDETAVVFVGAVVLVLNFQESVRRQSMEEYDESFMGYDFSEGYTSLERSETAEGTTQTAVGFVARWRERRRRTREARERAQDAQIEQQLDAILAKVHNNGIGSLSKHERQLLDRASARFQRREGNQPEAF